MEVDIHSLTFTVSCSAREQLAKVLPIENLRHDPSLGFLTV